MDFCLYKEIMNGILWLLKLIITLRSTIKKLRIEAVSIDVRKKVKDNVMSSINVFLLLLSRENLSSITYVKNSLIVVPVHPWVLDVWIHNLVFKRMNRQVALAIKNVVVTLQLRVKDSNVLRKMSNGKNFIDEVVLILVVELNDNRNKQELFTIVVYTKNSNQDLDLHLFVEPILIQMPNIFNHKEGNQDQIYYYTVDAIEVLQAQR